MSETAAPDTVTLTIDGQSITVPKGTNVLEAAKLLGNEISAFCYHPGLKVVAQCRQCLVSVEKNPKLQPSCQQTCGEGMVVHTTDTLSTNARRQMLEFTLVNHPIDCPICDKAGECTLQKLYFDADNHDSRVDTAKVHKDKAVDLGPTVVLDQERCILCSRCIRACDEVAGVHQLDFAHRGDHEVLTTAPGESLDNPYSLNVVDVCPVGALTSKDFRFTMRAWELEATQSVCNGCSTGCNIEVHHRNGRAWRIVPRYNAAVNKWWMCDEGRLTYHDLREHRLAGATVDGLPAGWDRAIRVAADRLASGRAQGQLAVALSGTCTNEDNFALAMLAKSWGHGKLRSADINANLAGVKAIAAALGLSTLPIFELPTTVKAIVALGDVLPGVDLARLKEIEYVALASHERGPVEHARIALPIAAWAEVSATVTNSAGLVQRMNAAVPAPGQALPGWEAVVRLAQATSVKLAWASAREVHADMTAAVPAWNGLKWAREARPLALRFAGSRG
ncbi:MAG: 2Fe-2S iron-sulfur cluster-binding protein [Proteobacteria bacterium]|nr:2Fe-2S iron-sulfur cluster-binding protein [Pseudomonadota bacterium]